jgi:hypothetical protein
MPSQSHDLFEEEIRGFEREGLRKRKNLGAKKTVGAVHFVTSRLNFLFRLWVFFVRHVLMAV